MADCPQLNPGLSASPTPENELAKTVLDTLQQQPRTVRSEVPNCPAFRAAKHDQKKPFAHDMNSTCGLSGVRGRLSVGHEISMDRVA